MLLELTTENFQKTVLEAEVPVLVDFFTPTCGPCRRLAPVLKELADETTGRFRVGKLDAFEHGDLATRYNISAVPTLLIFKDGEVVQSLVGYQAKDKLLAALQQSA